MKSDFFQTKTNLYKTKEESKLNLMAPNNDVYPLFYETSGLYFNIEPSPQTFKVGGMATNLHFHKGVNYLDYINLILIGLNPIVRVKKKKYLIRYVDNKLIYIKRSLLLI